MKLAQAHVDILEHTQYRAATGLFCGDSQAMQELVAAGLMHSRGKVAWCPDEYFAMTAAGRAALLSLRESAKSVDGVAGA